MDNWNKRGKIITRNVQVSRLTEAVTVIGVCWYGYKCAVPKGSHSYAWYQSSSNKK